ncbi:sugar kinase [Prevotella communis]|uniref:sugar kinase n=1 Tax=Prevotella communis TaxID=2913614 RepID=UPI001EDBB422|nr:sugar kinase [Prevotella communis]UKK56813.1 sugar kinase [Prevotella communis]
MKVVTLGEIMVRLGAPGYLKLIQANQFDVSYAGAEANVAVSLANYGLETDYITCLPDNPIAERCIMDLRGHKVGVDHILRTGKRMGILYLETGSNARPSKVYYDREDSSIATVTPGSIDWEEILKDATWFHWTGITPALSSNAAAECLKAIKAANELGVTVSCDINYRGNLWKYGKTAAEVMPEMVAGSDIILGNEEDCEKVFGIKPKDFDASRTNGNIDQNSFLSVCQQMMERFPRCKKMVVTLRGAINANHNMWSGVLYNGDELLISKRYDITDIVDRVGGGDSFMGGLIFGLLHYNDDRKALEFATAASCLKHTLKGDFNWVTVQEVENLIDGDTSGRVKR